MTQVLGSDSEKFQIGNFQPFFGKILVNFALGMGPKFGPKNGLEKSLS